MDRLSMREVLVDLSQSCRIATPSQKDQALPWIIADRTILPWVAGPRGMVPMESISLAASMRHLLPTPWRMEEPTNSATFNRSSHQEQRRLSSVRAATAASEVIGMENLSFSMGQTRACPSAIHILLSCLKVPSVATRSLQTVSYTHLTLPTIN